MAKKEIQCRDNHSSQIKSRSWATRVQDCLGGEIGTNNNKTLYTAEGAEHKSTFSKLLHIAINYVFLNRRNGHRFGPDHLDLVNLLPEDEVIAEVRANILGTRFQISSLYLDLLPPCLGQLVYKASLLHLHPRQMTLELTDLREDHTDPFGANLFGEDDGDGDDDDDDDEFSTLHQGVSMRDNILRAVTTNKRDHDDPDTMSEDPNVAIVVAPLPTRLSFALPSGGTTNANTPSGDIVEALQRQQQQQQQQQHSHTHSPVKAATVEVDAKVILDSETLPQSPPKRMTEDALDNSSSPHAHHTHQQQLHQPQLSSPAKMRLKMSLSCDNYLGDAKLALSRRDSVGSGSPHSSRGSPRRWAAKVEEIATPTVEKPLVPPQEDVMVTSAMAQLGGPPAATVMVTSTRECRSSSLGGGLDEIVDVLGVPSDLVPPSDLNKRLVLLKEEEEEEDDDGLWSKERRRKPTLEKSKSCEGVKRRRKKRKDHRHNIELKRRSLYGRDECKGRSEDKTCDKCAEVAAKVDDAQLNKEIFNVVTKSPKVVDEEVPKATINPSVCDTPKLQRRKMPQLEAAQKELNKEEVLFALEKHDMSFQPDNQKDVKLGKPQLGMPAIRENIPTQALLRPRRGSEQPASILDKQSSSTSPVPSRSQSQGPPGGERRRDRSASRRRFDSVRSLLEKARSILAISRAKRPTSSNSSKSKEEEETGAVAPPPCTPAVARRSEEAQQGENDIGTPRTGRRRLSRRQGGASFSPVRAILNSPLLRRKKQPVDSSEEELLQQSDGNNGSSNSRDVDDAEADSDEEEQDSKRGRTSFRDLETFQKQQLRHKLKKLTDNPTTSSGRPANSGQAPTPSPTPTQFLSPFLPRRAAAKMANSPLLRRKQHHQQQQQQQQQQFQQALNMKLPSAPPPVTVRRRRKLVLKNKEPMWNQTSQVYQLDFGGRVTQESAKNFQIEYKGKQVLERFYVKSGLFITHNGYFPLNFR